MVPSGHSADANVIGEKGNLYAGRKGARPSQYLRVKILRTDQGTSQPNRAAIEYWADGLEPIYLEGALARAQGRLP